MTRSLPSPHHRARRMQIVIAAVTAALLALTGVVVAISYPSSSLATTTEWKDLPKNNEEVTPWTHADPRYLRDRDSRDPGLVLLNEALVRDDRDAFLAFAKGEAVEQMAMWWDNTKKIGWEYAYIVPRYDWNPQNGRNLMVVGAELAFAASPSRGSGNPDAGLRLTQGFEYFINTEGAGKDLQITSFEPLGTGVWQTEPVHVVKTPHAVVYGAKAEQKYIESLAPQVEAAAIHALDEGERLTGERNIEGFIVAVTDDQDRYDWWTLGLPIESGGVAGPTMRPPRSEYIPEDVASGVGASGVFITIAPQNNEESRYNTLIHEFGHAIHLMSETRGNDAAAAEGFASFFEVYTGAGGSRLTSSAQKQIAAEGYGAFSQEALQDSEDSQRVLDAYAAAQSLFLFVEAQGGDPWQLAVDAMIEDEETLEPVGLSEAFESMNGEFTETAWQEWVAAQ